MKFSKGFADVVSGSFALITHSSWVRSPWVCSPVYILQILQILQSMISTFSYYCPFFLNLFFAMGTHVTNLPLNLEGAMVLPHVIIFCTARNNIFSFSDASKSFLFNKMMWMLKHTSYTCKLRRWSINPVYFPSKNS